MNTPLTTTTTVEQADALIESLGLTEMVEDYEWNELGHVYFLPDGTSIIVTSQSSATLTTATTTATVEQADALVETLGITEMVEDYECNELGHVYFLPDGFSIVVSSAR